MEPLIAINIGLRSRQHKDVEISSPNIFFVDSDALQPEKDVPPVDD